MSHEEEVFNYIHQWRDYIRSLNSPRLKPTPDFLEPRPPATAEEIDELKFMIEYEQQLLSPKPLPAH